MNYICITKNSDINENDTEKCIYYFHSKFYKDNLNYLPNKLNGIKMMRIANYVVNNLLFSVCYLPYSICYIYIENYVNRMDKLPPTLKMIYEPFFEIIRTNNIYNLPLLIKYIFIMNNSFHIYIYILETYRKITDVILYYIQDVDNIKKLTISYNLHEYSQDLHNKFLNLSIQN